MASYFTTKQGDSGTTRLISGDRVSKAHPAVSATGELDTLRAQLAEVRLMLLQEGEEEIVAFLFWLLHACFLVGTEVNDPLCKKPEYRAGTIGDEHISRIEVEQARLEAQLALPRAFLVSASNLLAARIDIVTTQARKVEREVVRLKEAEPGFDAADLLVFLNRASDYLCALARSVERGKHEPVNYEVLKERP